MLEAAIQEWTTSITTDIKKHGQRKADETNASAFRKNQPPEEAPATPETNKTKKRTGRTRSSFEK